MNNEQLAEGERIATIAAVEACYTYRNSFVVGVHHLADEPESTIAAYCADALADLPEGEHWLGQFDWDQSVIEAKKLVELAGFMVATGVGE